jgi:hypothetical protein
MTFICSSPFFDLAVKIVSESGRLGGHLALLETMHYTPIHPFISKPEMNGGSERAARGE